MSNPSYSEVLELHQKVYQMKARAEQAEKLVATLQAELDELRPYADSLSRSLERAEKQVAGYKESYEESCAETEQAEKQLAEMREQLSKAQVGAFLDVCANVERLQAELAAKDAEIRTLRTIADFQDGQMSAKDARIKELGGMLSKSLAADEL